MKLHNNLFFLFLTSMLCSCTNLKNESTSNSVNSLASYEYDLLSAYINLHPQITLSNLDIYSYGKYKDCEVLLIKNDIYYSYSHDFEINNHYFKFEKNHGLYVYFNHTLYTLFEAHTHLKLIDSEVLTKIFNQHKELFPSLYHLYTFKDFYKFPDFIEEPIQKIDISCYPGTVVPPWFNEHYTIQDNSYFLKLIDYLNNVQFLSVNDRFAGIGSKAVSIFTTKGIYSFSFSNYNEFSFDFNDYKATISFPFDYSKVSNSYLSLSGCFNMKLQNLNTIKELDQNYMDNIYFVEEKNNLLEYIPLKKDAVINFDQTSLYIDSNKTFYMNGVYYTIVGNKDFSDILPNKSSTTSHVIILDEDGNELKKYIVSNHIEYTAQELYYSTQYNMFLFKEDGSIFNNEEINEDITLTLKYAHE